MDELNQDREIGGMITQDVIAAISTPRGKGGVALLRVSGDGAFSVAAKVLRLKGGKNPSECEMRHAYFSEIYAPVGASGEWVPVDEGLATFFRGPASFTGEDVVEICCHGGVLLTETVLAALLASGARAAERGEFTRRAFLNGKMKLSGAEALAGLLEAGSTEQIRLAHDGMSGRLSGAVESCYQSLCAVMSGIYAAIDFPDEDLSEMTREEIGEVLGRVGADLDALIATYRTGHAIAEGIPTVICGRVNAGKSALFNRLVGRDAAIVTSVEGTTRDLLCETVVAGRVTLRLCDTAGLRETEDPVEQIGISRAWGQIGEAELILAVFDGSEPLDESAISLYKDIHVRAENAQAIAVINKCDKASQWGAEALTPYFTQVVSLSAETGEGMDVLYGMIENLFADGKLRTGEDVIVANARQHGALLKARQALREAEQALEDGLPYDLVSESLEQALRDLGQVDGRQVSQDVVAHIFSHFCVGK